MKKFIIAVALCPLAIMPALAENIVSSSAVSAGFSIETKIYDAVQSSNAGHVGSGTLAKVKNSLGCYLVKTEFYRHGDPNRGGLTCRVYPKADRWVVEASGPTHNLGTNGGSATSLCQAMCLVIKRP
ncbi:hypothetical protein K1718_13170 [Roseibium porphyridii]|uniref:Uncharacterized protein n=1 Tax=Roseibium porphyridii TaxID=2866279 RepID=A0ABY8FG98_9HYPH|nr:hypothetical protein [Roseibium sp. KMA01]WFE92270.1 hypothetical protein K1718_13170 [Roseibium sp. KMA01]